jgi:site-specific recombinase XerD
MDTQLATMQAVSYPADSNPALVYVGRLASGSRRTMQEALELIARWGLGVTDSNDKASHAVTFPWASLRYQHTAAIRAMLAEKYSASTGNKMLSALRGVLKEAWQLGYMNAEDYQRAINIGGIKGSVANQAEKGRHLRQGEFTALLTACDDGTKQGVRDAAIIILGYTAGLRRAEIAGLKLGDYQATSEDECQITIRQGKGNKERIIPLSGNACDVLADWLHVRSKAGGALFLAFDKGDNMTSRGISEQTVYDVLVKRAGEAGVKEFSPHDLRRTFAGDLLDNGADISTVQKLMGHANVNTTARYDRRDGQAKRKAVNTLHVSYNRRF